jgi:hypothetical protein
MKRSRFPGIALVAGLAALTATATAQQGSTRIDHPTGSSMQGYTGQLGTPVFTETRDGIRAQVWLVSKETHDQFKSWMDKNMDQNGSSGMNSSSDRSKSTDMHTPSTGTGSAGTGTSGTYGSGTGSGKGTGTTGTGTTGGTYGSGTGTTQQDRTSTSMMKPEVAIVVLDRVSGTGTGSTGTSSGRSSTGSSETGTSGTGTSATGTGSGTGGSWNSSMGSHLEDADVEFTIVSPSGKSDNVSLDSEKSYYSSDDINLDERGTYRFTLKIDKDGKTTTMNFNTSVPASS